MAMLVMTAISGVTVEVASRRPPSPTSSTAQSARRSGEMVQGGQEQGLEKSGQVGDRARGQQRRGQVADGADGAGEIAAGAIGSPVQADALAHVLQVRRGEQADPPAGALQDGGDVMRGRALAVGAGDLHVPGAAARQRAPAR